ncbi:restriction endonuclease [Streptomyces sp. TRM 70361]|uniref:nSTAND3 domain-containing NTPase n=1 Tax=Streptomyces sp. TRM 70361 TaxID=3116553 RepID=UPI002E7C5673|nr:restriction endonuclease [Streptomyces sp. TRM 70361]MEE1942310.1 restriction endonuclease [Streptomyces sp. TRM 70361]
MRDFSVLSDVEFEELVGDLLGAEHDTVVERFAAGADGGIDLRWNISSGACIAQCKHYRKSSFSQLLDSARKERKKVESLKPSRYLFITSFDLSVSQKDRIHAIFAPWMKGPGDVWGGRDVDALITRHSEVERRHPKLWVSTGMQLFWALHSDIANRTEALRQRIERSLPKYVVSPGYQRARDILASHNVCLISGPPGIGKTTLAQMLLAEYTSMRYEPVEVSEDINEAWTSLRRETPQVFLYDDFLGQITFAERLSKNEDKRLSNLIEKISLGGSSKKLILTTREYILRDAKLNYERLNELDLRYHFLLELKAYNKADRAQILYNHLWHSDVSLVCLREIAEGGYKEIIKHRSYNPRLIEYCTGAAFDTESPGYPERFKSTLDHPERIWKVAFEKHLTMEQQLLVIVLCTLPRSVLLENLQEAHTALCEALGVVSTEASFREALDVLEGTFIVIHKDADRNTFVRHLNPSVTEFALARIAADRRIIASLIRSTVFFEQLSELFLYGRGGSFLRPGNVSLMAALVRSKNDFLQAMAATINSPSSTQLEVRLTDGPTGIFIDPPEKMENRIQFYLQVDTEWNVSPALVRSAIDLLIVRWRSHTGDKSAAARTLKMISQHPLEVDASNEAHEALHTWFESTLNKTSDWYHYANHLSHYDNVDLDDMPDLAWQFENFMDQQLLQDHPPDDLDEMKSLAEDFGLYELSDRIEEVLQDEYEPDDDYEPDGSRLRDKDDRGSDEYIAELFGRLGE